MTKRTSVSPRIFLETDMEIAHFRKNYYNLQNITYYMYMHCESDSTETIIVRAVRTI